MPQQQSPFLEGKYGWNYGESGWNSGMDQNILKFSFLFDGNVDGVVATLPPVTNGAAYFNTADNRFYFGVDNIWYSSPCPKFFIFKIKSNGDFWQFDGTSASKIDKPSEVDARLTSLELTVSSLGSAAFEDSSAFATQAELDIVEANAQAYTDALRQDLADSTDPTKGAGMVGWKRSNLAAVVNSLSAFLHAQPINIWEFAGLITTKPNTTDPNTWDWTPAWAAAQLLRRPVLFPAGDFNIYGVQWQISDPDSTESTKACSPIIGAGSRATRIICHDFDTDILWSGHTIITSESFGRVEGWGVSGVTFLGGSGNTANANWLKSHGLQRCFIRDVVVRDIAGHGLYHPRDTSLEHSAGFSGGSDAYQCALSIDNLFIHAAGKSGIYGETFSAIITARDLYLQNCGEWGITWGGQIAWTRGAVAYNGNKAGLVEGQGGGIQALSVAGETRPMQWLVEQVEIDRNRFNQRRLTGHGHRFVNCRVVDSVIEGQDTFYAPVQNVIDANFCSIEGEYVRVPSDTGTPVTLVRFPSGATGNVYQFREQPPSTSGLVVADHQSTETPNNEVRNATGRVISCNRATLRDSVGLAKFMSGTAIAANTAIVPAVTPVSYLALDNRWSENIYVPAASGIFEISGRIGLTSFASTGPMAVLIELRQGPAGAQTTVASTRLQINVATSGENLSIPFSFTQLLNADGSAGFSIRVTVSVACAVADSIYSELKVERHA